MKPASVLVHGSFHGAWCWARLTPLLEAAGHRVIAPDQRLMVERTPCERVYRLDTDHSPFFSAPGALADVILTIADTVTRPAHITAGTH